MFLTFQCPHCNTELEVNAAECGTQAQCPQCSGYVLVPPPRVQPGTTLGNFYILEKIGHGGMGDVFRANQMSMDRIVALKVLPLALTRKQQLVDRFLHEVRVTARLEHPHIVTAFEAGEDSGYYYLAMSYVDGEDLSTRLKRDGAIPEGEALRAAAQVASGLNYAWTEHKLLHRDIKPSNIMVDRHGNAKLMDMGISKSLTDDNDLDMTMTGMLVGTLHYMSPEQGKSGAPLDFRADLYSLGATLYHCITGTKAYKGTDPLEVLTMHAMAPFPPPQERNEAVSDACAHLLEAMMAKDPNDRYSCWEALIDDMNRVLDGKHPLHPKPSMVRRRASSAPRRSDRAGDLHIRPPKGIPLDRGSRSATPTDTDTGAAGTVIGSATPTPTPKTGSRTRTTAAPPPVARVSPLRRAVMRFTHGASRFVLFLVAVILLAGIVATAIRNSDKANAVVRGMLDALRPATESPDRGAAATNERPVVPPPTHHDTVPPPPAGDASTTGDDAGALPEMVQPGQPVAPDEYRRLMDRLAANLIAGRANEARTLLQTARRQQELRPYSNQISRIAAILSKFGTVPRRIMGTFQQELNQRASVKLRDREIMLIIRKVAETMVEGRLTKEHIGVDLGPCAFTLDDLSQEELVHRLGRLEREPAVALYLGLVYLGNGNHARAREAFLSLPADLRDALVRRMPPPD